MTVIKLGDSGINVKEVHLLLKGCGYSVAISDKFDENTQKTVRAFQAMENNLSVDGIVGNQTLEALRNKATAHLRITENDFRKVANTLDVEIAAIKAVQKVETGGRGGFILPGKPKILFEGHIFWGQLKNPEEHEKGNEDILYRKWTKAHYLGGLAEYSRLEKACRIDKKAALMSASYGMFQIMGFNYAACGFKDVFSYVEAMKLNEGEHLKAFASFIRHNPKMLTALQDKKWADFAKLYNGPGYEQNNYDTLLRDNYEKFKNHA